MKQRVEVKKPQRQRVVRCPICGLYKPVKRGTNNQVSAHNSSSDYSKLCSGSDDT